MVTRIRYVRQEDNSLLTKNRINITVDNVHVRIVGLTYEIISEDGHTIESGTGLSNIDLKRNIKTHLKLLGAKFYDERRAKKKIEG